MDHPLSATLQNKSNTRNINNIIKQLKIGWLLKYGDEKKVIQDLLKSLDKDSLSHKLNLEEVNRLINRNIFYETRDYLEEAYNYYLNTEHYGQIQYLLARCYHGIGLLDEALHYLENAVKINPNNSAISNLQADCLLELGEWQAAVNALNKSLRSSPGDDETIYRLGSIYLFYGEYSEALNCFSGCCKLKPFNPNYWEMKAEMLIKLDQLSVASECLNKAIKYGGSLHLLSRLAYCYAKTNQINKAKRLLLKVLKYEPDDYDSLCNLAGIYHKLNKDEQAYKLLKKAYSLNSNDSVLLNNLGFICYRLGRSRKAIEYYNLALKVNPSDKNVLYNLASCLTVKGNYEDARGVLENLVSIDSSHSNAWTLLGNCYEQLSKYNIAVDCYNKSLGLA